MCRSCFLRETPTPTCAGRESVHAEPCLSGSGSKSFICLGFLLEFVPGLCFQGKWPEAHSWQKPPQNPQQKSKAKIHNAAEGKGTLQEDCIDRAECFRTVRGKIYFAFVRERACMRACTRTHALNFTPEPSPGLSSVPFLVASRHVVLSFGAPGMGLWSEDSSPPIPTKLKIEKMGEGKADMGGVGSQQRFCWGRGGDEVNRTVRTALLGCDAPTCKCKLVLRPLLFAIACS